MVENNAEKYRHKIITVPNILSFVRICLVPLIVWLYCFEDEYMWTAIIFILSGITDVVDGFIARKFNMVSEFGKAFDPVADKVTQIAITFCLVTEFPQLLIPLAVLIVKEMLAATLNMITLEKTGYVVAAVWHGKLNTVLIYIMMFTHIVWHDVPGIVSNILIAICIVMMLISSTLYTISDIKAIKKAKE